MNRQKWLKLALISLIIAVIVLALDYVLFHYVTDTGFTSVKQEEAGKPFVTDLVGTFGVLFVFLSAVSLVMGLMFAPKE